MRVSWLIAAAWLFAQPAASQVTLTIDQPMPAPDWALAERALLEINAEGVRVFADKYVDGRGYLRGPEHWGITDGPDDSIEPIRNWPLAHALGGPQSIIEEWQRVWEGHLDQYSARKCRKSSPRKTASTGASS